MCLSHPGRRRSRKETFDSGHTSEVAVYECCSFHVETQAQGLAPASCVPPTKLTLPPLVFKAMSSSRLLVLLSTCWVRWLGPRHSGCARGFPPQPGQMPPATIPRAPCAPGTE